MIFGKMLLLASLLCFTGSVYAAWNSPNNGNPVLPGYFADPSIIYDSLTKNFYIYSTTDGLWIDYSSEPQVAYSSDFVHWKFKPLSLPASWPTGSLWAPSVIRHPTNGRYYLIYSVGNNSANGPYIAYSTSPLGPWTNATNGNTPLYKQGEMWGGGDWFDAQFFVDTNTVYMTFGGGFSCGIAKLAFASNYLVSIDNNDPRMTDGAIHKYKRLYGLTDYNEGSCMFKKDGRYFLTYSNDGCQNYNVRYAVASSPVGPFTYIDGKIVQRDNANAILGTGHNSILQYGNSWYIAYHRQHYQYIDVKRQVCIDQIAFKGDTISAGVQTQAGVWQGSGSLESLVAGARVADSADLAFGKTVLASSESDYKGGTPAATGESFAGVTNFYAARYAVDRNNGTRWAPSTLPGYLIIDLGANYDLRRCETTFEYVMRTYKYRIDYLAATEAANITAARNSTLWHLFADRSANSQNVSPIIDSNKVTARYVKITVLSANLPTASNEIKTILETDYADRVSIVEFKVFGDTIPTGINGLSDKRRGTLTCNSRKAGLGSITVFDIKGRTIYNAAVKIPAGGYSFDISKLSMAKGIYFGYLNLPDGTKSKMFLTR